ncbi:MAG: ABC transporter ATP-binding protein [Methylobacteriaceae bacterium]|nr:ABC transporter ATP-binding protein [Methylobacteriaceae bacterium]
MASIAIERVSKSYGATHVLKEFSLDVADGEFIVLVGPSGCGKSTMLKILAGLEAASSGVVRIGERDVTDLAPGDRDIAMVFQNYALYPHLTVAQNMGFGLKMRGAPREEIARRVAAAAQSLGVEHLLDRRPRALSGGQRQRVALGRAIVREPQAFLMDEPLSNLDAKLRVHMRAEIGALHQRLRVTTIYVTHDQTEAMTMANRIVIMKDGEIQQIADPTTMFAQPANLFVAGFIGSPGMNFAPLARDAQGRAALFGAALPDVPQGERALVAGLRPEHIRPGEGAATFTVSPTLVEGLGSEQYVYFDAPDETPRAGASESRRMVARLIDAPPVRVGEPVRLSFDPARVHLFDAASGAAIAR